MTNKPWLVLDCYIEDPGAGAGNFIPHLGNDRDITVVTAPVSDMPDDPATFHGVLMTGSAASVLDRLPWVIAMTDFIRASVAQRVPVLGVCFGHQVLAEALTGTDAVRKAPLPELGWFDIDVLRPDPILAGFPAQFRTFLSHFDEVEPTAAGPNLEILARSEQCPVQAFRHPDAPAWGVQFHSEMALDEAQQLVRKRIGTVLPGDPEVVLRKAVDSRPLIRTLIDNFVQATTAHHQA
ncbi:MAG: type 1 glutamine amidotransferase [Myxococcota bacterium]